MIIILKKIFLLCNLFLVTFMTSCNEIPNTIRDSPSINHAGTHKNGGDNVILTLAMSYHVDDIDKVVESFNASDNGYLVELRIPEEKPEMSDDEKNHDDMELLQEIINTDNIDILCSFASFHDSLYFDLLKNKEVFADLYPFMEEDEEVNTSTLNAHVLSVNAKDGKLYTLPTFYNITTLTGEKSLVGEKENWTVDDFLTHWETAPENSTILGSREAEMVYYQVLRENLEYYVDFENVEVHFDSTDFRRLLEFCGQFQSNHGEKINPDYDAPCFVSVKYFDSLTSCAGLADSEYTLVGFPSYDEKGAFFSDVMDSFAISAKSSPDKQAAAWEFIRTFVTYEFQMEQFQIYQFGIPVNNQASDAIINDMINGNGYGGTYESKGEQYTIHLPTRADYNRFQEYLDTVNRWEYPSYALSPMHAIVEEEIAGYFAREKSLDTTIDMIQSRASIWVSEQS